MNWEDSYGIHPRSDYYKSDPAYTWYERQAKRMGRKLNLSHLSDTECRQILDVIQRDYQIRQKEKQRISKLSKEVHEEEQKRVVLSRQQQFNEKYCICCFSSFGLIFRKRIKCSNCDFFACKDCMAKVEDIDKGNGQGQDAAAAAAAAPAAAADITMCLGCLQQRELQAQACEWFYGQIKSRFRRFGSAKVVRSLYKRNSEGSDSGGEQSNSDSGVDQQLSPPPAAFASTPDADPAVVFMGQQGFVLVSNKQTNTVDYDDQDIDDEFTAESEDIYPTWQPSQPLPANMVSIGTQTPKGRPLRTCSDSHSEGSSIVESPIAVAYVEDVESSARLVSLGDEDDGARAVLEELERTRMDKEEEMGDNEMEVGDEEEYDNWVHMRRKKHNPEVVILSPDDTRNGATDDSNRKVKFDETPHIVQTGDDNRLNSSSIPYRILSPNDDMSSPECTDGNEVKGHQQSEADRLSGDGADKDDDFDDDDDEEDDDDAYKLHDNSNCGKFYSGDASYQDGAEGLSPRDFDSGIHMSYCLSLEDSRENEHFRSSQECLLSPDSRKPQNHLHSRTSGSLDSLTSMSIHSLDATHDTIDSLETHYHSGHNSPDINNDFDESGASTLIESKTEIKNILDKQDDDDDDDDDDDYNSVEIETMSLSRSSSEETLKTENEDDEREQEMILADFLDQLKDSSDGESTTNNNNDGSGVDKENVFEKLDLSKFVPNDAKSRKNLSSSNRTLYRCNSHPEFNNSTENASVKEQKTSDNHHHHHHSKSHKSKNVYKRSKSSDDFKYSSHKRVEARDFHLPGIGSEEAEANDTVGDMQQMHDKTSPTNRFIRYDSLPLVVEVCEAEYTSPSHHVSDFRRLSIEYGMYDNEGKSERSRKHRNRRMDWQRKFSPKNSQDDNDARQPSLESTTTEDTLPKSTSLSSAPTTPESDKWRRDSQALISSENESFSDSAKDHQKSPEKDSNRLLSLSIKSETKKDEIPDNRLAEDTSKNQEETKTINEGQQATRAFGKTKLMRSNRAVDEEISEKGLEMTCNDSKYEEENKQMNEDSDDNKTPTNNLSFALVKETSEKSVETDKVESHSQNTQCEATECNSKSLTPSSQLPETTTTTTCPSSSPSGQRASHLSPRTSPSNCSRKENLEIANLTKKVSMKHNEVLQSAEEVLSSANQLSDIQACVEDLECRMDSLEKSVVDGLSAESGSSEDEAEQAVPSQEAFSPQEQVAEDVQILNKQLARAQQIDRQTEANSATSLRLITSTALKVLSTTENIIESEHAQMNTFAKFDSDEDDTEETNEKKGSCHDSDENGDAREVIVQDDKISDEEENDELVAIERVNEQRQMGMSIRPSTEGMHLDLDGKEKREPSGDGCAISSTTQGAHCPSPDAQRSSTRQSPYGSSTGCAILHIEPTDGDGDISPLMATLLHDSDIQNGNISVASYETPTASSRPPVPNIRCLPTGSSQEDEAVEATVTDSPRSSPVGQEDAVQAALYEDIAELEEKVYLSASKVFTLEERLQQLERQVEKIDRSSPEDIISDLEDSLALTMAQVAQSESQVMSVEEQIAVLRKSRPTYSSTQVIDCPAKGSLPPHHHGVSLATINMDPSGSSPSFRLGVVQIEISRNCLEAATDGEEAEESPHGGAVQTAPFDDMIIRQTTGEKVDQDSEEFDNTDGEKKRFTSVRNRVALYEMHISESGSSTELEPRSPTKTASNSTDMQQKPQKVHKQTKVVS